ncbi:hypothetical protein [Lacinutrix salivirga]
MRAKLLLLLVFPILLLSYSCDEDDVIIIPEEEEPNAENSLYENDLFLFYLEKEIELSNAAIADLELLIEESANDPEQQEAFIMQQDSIYGAVEAYESEFQIAFEENQIGIIPPRLPVPPPPPCPGIATCLPAPDLLKYILVFSEHIENGFLIEIVENNSEELIYSNANTELTPLDGTEELIFASNIDLGDFNGEMRINITRNVNGKQPRSYSVRGNIGE